jgi:hypothetical protein
MKRLWIVTALLVVTAAAVGCNHCKSLFSPRGAACDVGPAPGPYPYAAGYPMPGDPPPVIVPGPQ